MLAANPKRSPHRFRCLRRERYVSSSNACEARHFHAIWLLAKGHTLGKVAEMMSFAQRWIEQLAARYNAVGSESSGDSRRGNRSTAPVLKPLGVRAQAETATFTMRRSRPRRHPNLGQLPEMPSMTQLGAVVLALSRCSF
ncbi:hypothetical protein [Methylosinus sporium]|uniref:hypothetical protein n=1 Tax=Methylosinus sporium TaxID=428 RepID=UPI003839D58B